jgi:hypothetical protein
MKLTIGERFILGELLPKEASFKSMKILRKLRESLSFSEEELTTYKITTEELPTGNSVLRWDTGVEDAEIVLGEHATTLVKEALAKLDAAGKISDREYSLYEKFMDTGE